MMRLSPLLLPTQPAFQHSSCLLGRDPNSHRISSHHKGCLMLSHGYSEHLTLCKQLWGYRVHSAFPWLVHWGSKSVIILKNCLIKWHMWKFKVWTLFSHLFTFSSRLTLKYKCPHTHTYFFHFIALLLLKYKEFSICEGWQVLMQFSLYNLHFICRR